MDEDETLNHPTKVKKGKENKKNQGNE